MEGTLTGTTTPGKSEPRSNVNDPHYQMQFSVIPRTPFFKGDLLISKGYSQYILGFANRMIQ